MVRGTAASKSDQGFETQSGEPRASRAIAGLQTPGMTDKSRDHTRSIRVGPGPLALWIKRVFDLVLGTLLLVPAVPVGVVIGLFVRRTSKGPVLFRQARVGRHGEEFEILKFRTMVHDADLRKQDLKTVSEADGLFKIRADPRVTPIGTFLRQTYLDELPQLINVMRGEMSLVGPRPLPVEEVHRFQDDAHRRRLSVPPGLTCLWQVRGRNEIDDFDDWVRLDLEYIDNWSLWLDAKILVATVPAVLLGRGGR